MRISQLSKRDIKNILIQLPSAPLSVKDKVQLLDDKIILVNDKPFFFLKDNSYMPTLKLILRNIFPAKKITVDMGAVPFVIKGADIMRPGISDIEVGINKGDWVIIVDENHKKPLAIGKALMDSEDMRSSKSGKVIRNLHFIGDDIWNLCD